MERRYEEALRTRLEDVMLHGCAHVTQGEFRLWYGVKKFAAGSMRDLCQRWQEMTGGKKGELTAIWGRDGYFLFGERTEFSMNPDK